MREGVSGDNISLAAGLVDQETLPHEAIAQLSQQALSEYGAAACQYGSTEGNPELRQALADRYGFSADEVLVTNGSQQGLSLCLECL